MAETLECLMEKQVERKEKEIEDYWTRCRESMEAEIELHITEYRKQHKALFQESLNTSALVMAYMEGAIEQDIESLRRHQKNAKIAKDLADSQSLASSSEIAELSRDEVKLILSTEAPSDG